MTKHYNNNNLRIISLNVQGLQNFHKRGRTRTWINCQKANIVFLQETHFTENMTRNLNLEWDSWEMINSYGTSSSRGCSIIIKKSNNYEVIDFIVDENGRYVFVNIEICNHMLTLVNVYAPNDNRQRNAFYKKVNTLIQEKTLGLVVMGGDFNECLKMIDRKTKQKTQTSLKNNRTFYIP